MAHFTINETTIGIKGSSGEAYIGGHGDMICHMKIPGHWIFTTSKRGEFDFLGWMDAMRPVGKNGRTIDLEYELRSPESITYWSATTETIGWYGCTTNMEILVNQFKEMGKWLQSAEAKTEFEALYNRPMYDEYEPEPVSVASSVALSDEERKEKNRKARERAKKRKQAVKAGPTPVGMVYSV